MDRRQQQPQGGGMPQNGMQGTPQMQGGMQGGGMQGMQGSPQGTQGTMQQQMQGAQTPQQQMMSLYPYGTGGGMPTSPAQPQLPAVQASYIENILRLNQGKIATVYMSFETESDWSSKVFRGEIEAAGRDHIILSDPQTGKRYLLPMLYLDYITFQGPINYQYPFASPLGD